MTHDVKVPFLIPEFPRTNIILHHFNVDNNEGEPGIGYEMKIGCDLMVQLGLIAYFKRKLLQWDGSEVIMKVPGSFPGKTELTSCEI